MLEDLVPLDLAFAPLDEMIPGVSAVLAMLGWTLDARHAPLQRGDDVGRLRTFALGV